MDDALQEAYVKAFRALPGFREDAGLGTWLYPITYRACVDLQRRESRHQAGSHRPGATRPRRPAADPATTAATRTDLPGAGRACRSTSGPRSCWSTPRASTTTPPPPSSGWPPGRSPPACRGPGPPSGRRWPKERTR